MMMRRVRNRNSPRDAPGEVVDGVLQDPGAEQLEGTRADDAEQTDDERATITVDVGQQRAEGRRHIRSSVHEKRAPGRSRTPAPPPAD